MNVIGRIGHRYLNELQRSDKILQLCVLKAQSKLPVDEPLSDYNRCMIMNVGIF